MKLSVEDNGKRSVTCLPCTGHCAKLPYTPGLISTMDLFRNIVAVMWTYTLSTEEDSDAGRASCLLKVSHWQELALPVPLSCSQMEEYPRGRGQLWGGSQSGHRGGKDEDTEQGGLPGCKGPICRTELGFLSKAVEEEK